MLRTLQWLLAKEPLVRALKPLSGSFNPLLPEHRRDPHATWRAMRENQPVFHSRLFGAHFVFRCDDVLELLRGTQLSADRSGTALMRLLRWFNRDEPDFGGFMERNLLMLEGSEHRTLRGLVGKAFTPRRVEALRPRLERIVEDLLDRVASDRRMNLVSDLAYPFPVTAIAELLGVPTSDHERFRRWTADLVQILDPLQGTQGVTPMQRATRELYAYFRPLLAARRSEPRDDLISAMLAAEEGGARLEEGDLLALCTLLLAAGHETTANLIANAVAALVEHPEERRRLIEEPQLMPLAVDEFLRYDSPVQFTDRAVAEDCEFRGVRFRKGQLVALVLASANRDPTHF